jgi:hypothetical protein
LTILLSLGKLQLLLLINIALLMFFLNILFREALIFVMEYC